MNQIYNSFKDNFKKSKRDLNNENNNRNNRILGKKVLDQNAHSLNKRRISSENRSDIYDTNFKCMNI